MEKKRIIFLSLIILLGAFLSFINYSNRFGLASDQARDVLVVREMLKLHTLPIIGPFSAAGSFVFGPYWYWVLLFPIGLFPHFFLAPWIFQTLLSVSSIFFIYLVGKNLSNPFVGLLAAFFASISTAKLKLATNLTISSFVGSLSAVIMYLFIRYIKTKELTPLLFLALLIGIVVNTHFEAIPLILLLAVAISVGKKNISHIVFPLVIFCLTFTPLLIFDFSSNHYELKNILNFHQHLSSQAPLMSFIKKFITFLTIQFPSIWTNVIGNFLVLGYAVLAIFLITFTIQLRKNRLTKEIKITFFSFFSILLIISFYIGTIFQAFLAFLYPLIFFCTAWTCNILWKWNKYFSFLLAIVITGCSIFTDIGLIKNTTNNAFTTASYWEKNLIKNAPEQTFTPYDYKKANLDKSLPLSLLLDVDNKEESDGMDIAVASVGAPINYQIFVNGPTGLRIYDIDNVPDTLLNKEGFQLLTPDAIYQSVEEWYK